MSLLSYENKFKIRIGLISLTVATGGRYLINELLGYIKGRKFLDYMRYYQLINILLFHGVKSQQDMQAYICLAVAVVHKFKYLFVFRNQTTRQKLLYNTVQSQDELEMKAYMNGFSVRFRI
jgi:hypothetical protein